MLSKDREGFEMGNQLAARARDAGNMFGRGPEGAVPRFGGALPIVKAMPGGGLPSPGGAPLGQIGGIVSRLVGGQAPGAVSGYEGMAPTPTQQETPRQRAARQAANKAGRAKPADATAKVVPPGQLNRPEVSNRGFVTNAMGRMF